MLLTLEERRTLEYLLLRSHSEARNEAQEELFARTRAIILQEITALERDLTPNDQYHDINSK